MPQVLKYAVVFISVVGAFLFLLVPGAWMVAGETVRKLPLKEREVAIERMRTTMVTAAGGAALLGGLVFTGLTYRLSRRGQETDRYGKAVAQLASSELVERLGGLYALEHVMRESERDHETIVEVLAAFVRQRASVQRSRNHNSGIAPDVVAAMVVLARRPQRHETNRVDLRHTELSGLELPLGARLARFDLREARLIKAQLPRVDLTDAWLAGTDMTEAVLSEEADLSGAWLTKATLRETHLEKAKLVAAKLDEAELIGTRFDGADLTESWLNGATQNGACFLGSVMERAWLLDLNLESSQGLTLKRLLTACPLRSTKLPAGMDNSNTELHKRIADCQDGPHRHLPERPFALKPQVNDANRGARRRRP
ncbi:pentapeptide repeat-containing protein [Streptomyces sp. NBC_01235]|uniref:pentapeptide repeat-containing protein n=1 Tax=Streptomyces sp. NBC_01235 TaxID=2903788 RepID=UPI002E12D279|nr:pentapeptide repeat-containing protein [Streptomyces sp. NBC_01235]